MVVEYAVQCSAKVLAMARNSTEMRIRNVWRLLQIVFMTISFQGESFMSVKAMMATILQDQMTLRGVNSLSPSDYEQIVELLIEQLRELELSLAALELTHNDEPQ